MSLCYRRKPLEEAITLFKQQLNRIAHYSCESKPLKEAITLFKQQLNRIAHHSCGKKPQPPVVPQAMRDGVLKSVWDEEQRIKHIEEMEQKCIQ
ncbi:hypothetical protein pdam_00023449, partial [Pocillopora damicornis]